MDDHDHIRIILCLLYLSMDVRILTQPTALQCRKDFSVGGGVTSKAAIFRGKALLNGEISEMVVEWRFHSG